MKKDFILLIVSIILTLGIAFAGVRLFFPQLLNISPDLQLVKVDKKVPPFFENIFRKEDFFSEKYLINDPVTGVRAKPLYPNTGGMGPNDLLGFRNRSIPNSADIVVIGDSQTYGNNAAIDKNWPGTMISALKPNNITLYNMSVGGWSAPQYFNMLGNAMVLKPKVIVIAFYSGNDPMESFIQVYGNPIWKNLIPDHSLTRKDVPKAEFPPPKKKQWLVLFKDGVKTVFTPSIRLVSNQDHPAVHAGYQIMADISKQVAHLLQGRKVKVFFTIIPTKELVYEQKIKSDGLELPDDYRLLIAREKANIEWLVGKIKAIPLVGYIDVVHALQNSAMRKIQLYPPDDNGHPFAAGYGIIGRKIAEIIRPVLPIKEIEVLSETRELLSVEVGPGQYKFLLRKNNGIYYFSSIEAIEKNGWPPGETETITQDGLSNFPVLGVINTANPSLYGPLK